MGKFDGILLCSDFDGTFARGGVPIEANMKAIKYFKENGGMFAIASGRDHPFLENVFGDYKFGVPMICFNGAVIYDYDNKTVLSSRKMKGVSAEKLLQIASSVEGVTHLNVFTGKGFRKLEVSDGKIEIPEDLNDFYKFAVRVNGEKSEGDAAKEMIAKIMTDHVIERSSSNYIEVLEPESTKSPSTLALKKAVGAHTLVCVGDYENDIEMVRTADVGYAVDNAIDELKAVADRITVSCEEGAIAKIIEEL